MQSDKIALVEVVKDFAVLQSGCVVMSGFLARLVWVLIYIQFLAEGSLWFSVFFQRVWTYLSAKRGCLEALLTANLRHQPNIKLAINM